MPELSVIVPIYNVEPYLCRCLDSLLAQSFTDFELILIDDGSLDRCGEIIEDYAAREARIVTIHQENRGLCAARNAGLDVAKGEYVMFCDSDDSVSEKWAETMLRYAKRNQYALVCCSSTGMRKRGGADFFDGKNIKEYGHREFCDFLITAPVGVVWNKVFKRSVLESAHVRFPEEIVFFGEDKIFVLDYLLAQGDVFSACVLKDELYYYNASTPNSLSKRFSEERNRFLSLEKDRMLRLGRKYGMERETIDSFLALKQARAVIEMIRGITTGSRFPMSYLELRSYVRSPAFQTAVGNPDLGQILSGSFCAVLRTKSPFIIYLYDLASRIKS